MNVFTRRDAARLTLGAWLAATINCTAPSALAASRPRMEHRRLGTMNCSLTGLGLVTLGRDGDMAAAARLIHTALDNGINFFDTGQVYGDTPDGRFLSEPALGQALVGRRHQAYISTKCGYDPSGMPRRFTGFSAANIEANCDHSLKQLRTDYIDLYQLHRAEDADVPIEETLGAMSRLVEKGKVRNIGTTNGKAELLRSQDTAARRLGTRRFISTQAGLSLLSRRATTELIPTLQELDIGLIPTTPLANGFLTGTYRRGEGGPSDVVAKMRGTDKNYDTLESLEQWALDHGHDLLDLAFAWVAAQPQVISIIAGASKEKYVVQNAKATQWKLTAAQAAEVAQIASGFEERALMFPRPGSAPAAPGAASAPPADATK
jgi:aryl-alcohol dehydrogenase-like predicted oxidoreductase